MNRTRRFSALVLLSASCLATPLYVFPADARPGGGQTFRKSSSGSSSSSSSSSTSSRSDRSSFPSSSYSSSDGSSSRSNSSSYSSSGSSASYSSSGGSGSGGGLSGMDVLIALGALAGVMFVGIVQQQARQSGMGWASSSSEDDGSSFGAERLRNRFEQAERELARARAREDERRKRYTSVMAALEGLRSKDDEFSLVLFEDFLYSLYAEVQAARGKGTLQSLLAYLREGALAAYHPYSAAEVRDVVIGSMTFVEVIGQHEPVRRIELLVQFEVNYTEVSQDGRQQSYWVVEKWRLVRDADVKSRPPEKTRLFGCPNCGAPQEKAISAKCVHCGTVASVGELDWTVMAISVDAREPRGPMLTETTEEVGTDYPTIAALDVQQKYQALKEKDPSITFAKLQARIEVIFRAFHEGWSTQELAVARPYLSDHLFQFQRYWIDTYRRQALRNITEDARIVTIQICRIINDKHFDAITVRVFAACRDYTVNQAGEVVAGSRTKERTYSEYWTLIRGAERRGAPRTDPVCPNCGAPNHQINMAGTCGHCQAHLTSGEFDWVLSRIEQDEVYQG